MKIKTLLLFMVLICTILSGCVTPSGKNQCEEGLTTAEYLSDPDAATVANINLADLNNDGADEIFSARPLDGIVTRAICNSNGCTEQTFSDNLVAPVRTHIVDLDGDGLTDLIVSDIGILPPSDEYVGKVVLFKALGDDEFESTIIIDGIGRTVSAESGDIDSDGDLDLVVCEFGNTQGSIFWLEATDNSSWVRHTFEERPGAINAYPIDIDDDGDLDVITSLSQDDEEINIYLNDGTGQFTKNTLIDKEDTHYGMSGLEIVDLDQDGDIDIVYSNGDTLDMDFPDKANPNEYHGVAWLENEGNGQFIHHELTRVWGAFIGHPVDIDSDGDLDIIIGTFQLTDYFTNATRIDLVLLENDGDQSFTRHSYNNHLRYVITFDSGDIDGDGDIELIGGSHRMSFDGPSHRGIEFKWSPPGSCE
jgi:hypothetical protein